MAAVAATSVSLRFFGDDLIPDSLTRALGRAPTRSAKKSDVIAGRVTGKSRIARTGSWSYALERREPGDLDDQIQKLFGALVDDLSVWRALAAKYEPDLFVGLFMNERNEGLELSVRSLETLSARGVRLGLDIYGPGERADEQRGKDRDERQ